MGRLTWSVDHRASGVRDGNLFLPPRLQAALRDGVHADLDAIAVAIWLLVLALAVVLRYGDALLG